MADTVESRTRNFTITVLGRTLEHLGTQMYKRRDVALAELVANAWDAGATEVRIEVPPESSYSPTTSHISVADNGGGMSESDVQDNYLVIGRNRGHHGGRETSTHRRGVHEGFETSKFDLLQPHRRKIQDPELQGKTARPQAEWAPRHFPKRLAGLGRGWVC